MDPTPPAAPASEADDPVVRERRWIAAELHDGPAQALANAVLALDLIERGLAAGDREPALAEIRRLRERLRDELVELRGLIGRVVPPRLAELGLTRAIEERAELILGVDGPALELQLAASGEALGDRARAVALRVVEEALHNVRRHARASRVSVRSWQDDSSWSIEVRDDGCGFDPGTSGGSDGRRFGLGLMGQRASMIDGTIAVRSRPGEGTTVTLSVPIRKEPR